jgi:hypothetical protein
MLKLKIAKKSASWLTELRPKFALANYVRMCGFLFCV